ncbi:hypothetical protein CALCODRAFT_485572 [Calocera cornea HHB12733]|uniref:Uncharacterized protein n=1 Tax=Calocera cornea HHB12733 TaxID=1353952 RepID=A0A165EAL5_9BASI|nr:hypothetical protein CALCODRAFT_485572 [Calocera cornea HHB12733]
MAYREAPSAFQRRKHVDNALDLVKFNSKKITLKDQMVEKEKQMAEMQALLLSMQAQLTKTQKKLKLEKKKQKVDTPAMLIPKPAGQAGRLKEGGYRLQSAMGLEDDGAKYNEMLGAVRVAAIQHGIQPGDTMLSMHEETLAKVFKAARLKYPELAKYKHDWATRDMVKQYVKNKRYSAIKPERERRRAEKAAKAEEASQTLASAALVGLVNGGASGAGRVGGDDDEDDEDNGDEDDEDDEEEEDDDDDDDDDDEN